jgi:sortase A
MVMPDLQLDVPVQDMPWHNVQTANGVMTEWNIPQNAAGHATNSALPGQAGNIVISGHNNIEGKVFLKLSQAWPSSGFRAVDKYTDSSDVLDGKKVELYTAGGKRWEYSITAFYRLKEANVPLSQQLANARYISPTTQPQLTITTCWPPWGNVDRLIIIAVPRS